MSRGVTILGAGAFGTAIATLLSNNGYKVILWCYESEVAKEIQELKENRTYFPGIKLDKNIFATRNLKEALSENKWVFQAIPVTFLRSILQKVKLYVRQDHIFVSLSKGIENDTFLFPTQVIQEVLGKKVRVAVMAGPTFATELAQKYYTAATVSASDEYVEKNLTLLLLSSYFKPEISNDFIGVQVGGAIKNVIALAVGLVSHSLNTMTVILTKGLGEIALMAKHVGGNVETVYGLSGFGDLVLTATGSMSKNLAMGRLLGSGKTLKEVQGKLNVLPEGINTVKSIYQLIGQYNLKMPICKATYDIIFNGKPISQLYTNL
jgi:glycerol-3-phosphate dehydrogenase (NAD(P)+)